MPRVGYLLLVPVFVAFLSVDCEAQLFQRHRVRNWDWGRQVQAPVAHSHLVHGQEMPVSNLAPASRLPKWPNFHGYDPRIHRDADHWSRYPKYIGGFHSSHFTNVGLPTGDIGFRGNGLYWTPW